ncbi:MAG: DsbA family protein [Legionellales bacterium]|nr:DsbA family protein [Legionellales bacterium]
MKFIKKVASVGMTFLVVGAFAAPTQPQTPTTLASNNVFTPEQNTAITDQVKTYLDNNPKAVVDALVSYRQQELKRMESQAQNAISKNAKEIFQGTNLPTLGNPEGTTILVEFLDYQCGHCKTMSTTVKNLIGQNKNLKVIVKELPILGEESSYAAKVALAANEQGKFAEVHTALLNNTEKLTNQVVESIAKSQGVDWSKIETALQSNLIEKELDQVFAIAQQLNIMGTPAFIISDASGQNNRYFGGAAPQETMQKTINEISKT